MRPDPLNALSGGDIAVNDLVAEVEVQDVHAGVEGLIAVVQSGGNGEGGTDIGLLGAGVPDGDHLVHVVLGGGHTQLILLALCRADDGGQLLVLREGLKAILTTLLLDQVDLDVAHGKGVGFVVGVGEVGQRGTDDGDGGQRHAQEQGSDLLFHVIALLFV